MGQGAAGDDQLPQEATETCWVVSKSSEDEEPEMKHRTPRKRATAKSRASKREPLATLRNPKPHIPAPMAPRVPWTPSSIRPTDWREEGDVPPDEPDYWFDEFAQAEAPPVERSNAVLYWLIAIAIAGAVLVWWLT